MKGKEESLIVWAGVDEKYEVIYFRSLKNFKWEKFKAIYIDVL